MVGTTKTILTSAATDKTLISPPTSEESATTNMRKKSNQLAQAPRKANALDAYVGIRLRERRVMLGLSQEDLGDIAGIADQQIQKYESGRDRISASRLFLLATALGVTTDWFFEGFDQTKTAGSSSGGSALESDEATLLRSYRGIGDEVQRSVVLKIARSFARGRK